MAANSLDEFELRLSNVAWFSKLGQPSSWDGGCARIYAWDQWPGPGTGLVMALALMGQDFHDRIFAASTLSADALQELFDRMYAIVMERARSAVPCKSGPDPWHGPTQCVADAAYLTGLIGCVLASGWPVPDDLAELWNWFASGHWPAGFTHEPGDRPAMNEDEVTFPRRLLVY